MIITPERFQTGFTWEQYLNHVQRNRDLFQKSYDSVELTDEEIEWLRRYPHQTHILWNWRRLVSGRVR